MFHQPDLFASAPSASDPARALDLPDVIARIAESSARPRYAFMVLNLIARAARQTGGRAGPHIVEDGRAIPLRDWLSDSLIPMARRDPRRVAITEEIRAELSGRDMLPSDPVEAGQAVDCAVRERVRRSGRCNISRAVSDLVRAGLIRRHYQGRCVDHVNRGAQREAVYIIMPAAAEALAL